MQLLTERYLNFACLSRKNTLQMVDMPETVFEEASRAAGLIENSDTGLITLTKPGEEVPEGLVAEILTMVANNTAHLSVPPPQVLACPLLLRFPPNHGGISQKTTR